MNTTIEKKQTNTCLQALVNRSQKQPQNEVKKSLFLPHNVDESMKIIFNHQNYVRWGDSSK